MENNNTTPQAIASGKDEIALDDLPALADEFRHLASASWCSGQLRDQLLIAAARIDAFVQAMQTEEFISGRKAVEASIKALLPIVECERARHVTTSTGTVQ